MSSKLIELTNGTLGDFCIRCHTPVGMALQEPIVMSNMDRHPTSREGVTCVVCHRINQNWGKGAGRQALIAGDLGAPIVGPIGNEELANVLANPDQYGVMAGEPDPAVRSRIVHSEVIPFFAQTTPSFCGRAMMSLRPTAFDWKTRSASSRRHLPLAKSSNRARIVTWVSSPVWPPATGLSRQPKSVTRGRRSGSARTT